MPAWITVYCRERLDSLGADELLRGIRGGDPEALAGVDYWTLAEDYGVDEDQVDRALAQLAVVEDGSDWEIRYSEAGERSVVVHRWFSTERVAEEIEEVLERLEPSDEDIVEHLRASREVVGIELGFSQFEDMGVVIAYEVARYLMQKLDGLILNDEDRWLVVVDGAFFVLG